MENNTPHHDHGILKKLLFFLKFLEIRLRFVLILVVTALVVGYWDNIQNYFERWQRNSTAAHAGHTAAEHQGESEFEFFCPMHPFVIRDHKDKCPICGMDLVQRKKGAPMTLPEGVLARVQVSPDRVMQAGIQVEPVAYRLLTRTVRTYGIIEPDETRLSKIIARFPGRIDKLMVNAVGMTVQKGEPLAQIYSPKFLAATQEYVQALKAEQRAQGGPEEKRRAAQLTQYSRQRLLLAGFTEEQIKSVSTDGKLNDSVELHSPLAGTVLEKNALLGESVDEGSSLYTIADLSKVWVQALVIESDVAAIKANMPVEVSSVSYPSEIFFGSVDFVYPTVSPENRSVKVRVVVDNAAGKLKPGMYVTAVVRSPLGRYGEAGSFSKEDKPQPATVSATHAGHNMAAMQATAKPVKLPTETQADADRFLASLPAGAEYYTCSMDPEVVSDKPGDCPKCGMHLEKRRKEATASAPAAHAGHGADAQTANAPGVKLPTEDQAAADKYLATLAPGAQYYTCSMHPEVVSDKPGDCPKCGMHLEKRTKSATSEHQGHQIAGVAEDAAKPSTERWAEGYSCDMHPDELSDKPGVCTICGCGMELKKVQVERVLSIPEMAVVDTGTKYVVYVESSPGIYDSRAVKLGSRTGAFYPVIEGLKLGDKIVSRGSFLIDAEARLNPTATAPGETQSGGHQHGG